MKVFYLYYGRLAPVTRVSCRTILSGTDDNFVHHVVLKIAVLQLFRNMRAESKHWRSFVGKIDEKVSKNTISVLHDHVIGVFEFCPHAELGA